MQQDYNHSGTLMKNPLLKNNKTWLHGDIQHRTSHYNRILAAKPSYTCHPKIHESMVDNLHCKFKSNFHETRKVNNQKLVQSLAQIDSQCRYPSFSSKKTTHWGPKVSLLNHDQNRFKQRISIENYELYLKLRRATPLIGSMKEWKARKKTIKDYSKLLNRNRRTYLQMDQQFYNAFSRIKQFEAEQHTHGKNTKKRMSRIHASLTHQSNASNNNTLPIDNEQN